MPSAPTSRSAGGEQGFTLLELLVVVTILALIARLVMVNYGAMVPGSRLDADASKIVSIMEQARIEATLRLRTMKVEFDLDLERFRLILPPEMKLTIEDEDPEELDLGWDYLDNSTDLFAYVSAGEQEVLAGRFVVEIDHNGYTADQVFFIRPKSESLEEMVWSIQFRGFERGGRIVRDQEGNKHFLEQVEEFSFR